MNIAEILAFTALAVLLCGFAVMGTDLDGPHLVEHPQAIVLEITP